MSAQDEVQVVVDQFCKDRGYTKKSGSWYRLQEETIAVLNLQRSQYSHEYYLNAALWFLALGEVAAPKEHTCHVRMRADQLVADGEALNKALDLEHSVAERATAIVDALTTTDDLLRACGSVDSCRRSPGRLFIDRALVRGAAQELLLDQP